jgi:hypothetical protein
LKRHSPTPRPRRDNLALSIREARENAPVRRVLITDPGTTMTTFAVPLRQLCRGRARLCALYNR